MALVMQAKWRKAQKEENAMLAAKSAVGEPLPERLYTHATKPKPMFLKKFAQKAVHKPVANQQPSGTAAPGAVGTNSANVNQPSSSVVASPPAPASPDSSAAKPASVAVQDSSSSADSAPTAQQENGFNASDPSTDTSHVHTTQNHLRGSRKALFADDELHPVASAGTGELE